MDLLVEFHQRYFDSILIDEHLFVFMRNGDDIGKSSHGVFDIIEVRDGCSGNL